MIDIAETDISIRAKRGADVVYFDNLSRDRLRGVVNYFRAVGQGKAPALGSRFKIVWIGFRGMDA